MYPLFTFSDLLGYTSIACWLGAQFPQVLENWNRQSCEGLALPFLANWFLGDLSNLIGCILTHQLPFQRWLATYFVFVDLALVVQYFYYTQYTKSLPSYGHRRPTLSVSRTRRRSTEREVSRYRTLSAVAANVATTAALAAQHDEIEHRHKRHRHTVDQAQADVRGRSVYESADEDVDDGALALLSDSFHSERGQDARRKRISWSIERHRPRSGSLGQTPGILPMTAHPQISSTEGVIDSAGRGRTLERESGEGLEISPGLASSNRQNSRASRRGTMVFLSMWALFGIGTLAVNRHGVPMQPTSGGGMVLVVRGNAKPGSAPHFHASMPVVDTEAFQDSLSYIRGSSSQTSFTTDPFNERAIGRIFAWLCTTLYLTSRLPQIWKNFVRKSVEGLSMYLFVFAFLGNVFYVASILSSPRMSLPPEESLVFLKESIPYLLGSGGTLMFDVTIVTQSFVYRPRHRRHLHGRHEEEGGLLTGDSAVYPSDPTTLPRGRTSRIRGTN